MYIVYVYSVVWGSFLVLHGFQSVSFSYYLFSTFGTVYLLTVSFWPTFVFTSYVYYFQSVWCTPFQLFSFLFCIPCYLSFCHDSADFGLGLMCFIFVDPVLTKLELFCCFLHQPILQINKSESEMWYLSSYSESSYQCVRLRQIQDDVIEIDKGQWSGGVTLWQLNVSYTKLAYGPICYFSRHVNTMMGLNKKNRKKPILLLQDNTCNTNSIVVQRVPSRL